MWFSGKKPGVGCHFLLQGIFLTQGWNPCFLHCRQTLWQLCHQGSPEIKIPLFLNFWGKSGLSMVEITHKIVFAARKIQAEENILSGNAVKWFTILVISLDLLIQGWCLRARINFANLNSTCLTPENPEGRGLQSNPFPNSWDSCAGPQTPPLSSFLELSQGSSDKQREKHRLCFIHHFSGLHFLPSSEQETAKVCF